MTVDVVWHSVADSRADNADAALADHLRQLLGDGDVRVGRLCPRCASADHGRPWATHGGRPVHVSLSRSAGYLVTALSTEHPVGVDVESIADVNARWDAALVLASDEHAESALERSRIWAAKEAVLKAYGVGLALPMTALRLADFGGQIVDVPAPDGLVAASAQLSERS
jgi:4'-phosphopantetheinyl transferase